MEKILLYGWDALEEGYTINALKQAGYEVIEYRKKMKDYDLDSQVCMELMSLIYKERPEYLFSIDFFPLLASVAKTCTLPYVSWIYDSPHNTLYSKTAGYRGNYIFIFDRKLCENMRAQGNERVFYMPLGVDCDALYHIIEAASQVERENYRADVSFVGRFYADRYNYYYKLEHMSAESREWVGELIERQKFYYERNLIGAAMWENGAFVEEIVRLANLELGPRYEPCQQDMAAALLGREVTAEERRELIGDIADRFTIDVYTDSDISDIKGVRNRGRADYLSQMPLVFHESKINLNITLRTIESGIPLRALDIMASGGFLLSNYQPELEEWFIDKEELVLFTSREDCLEKIEYYLKHDEERTRIAKRGQEKVKRLFHLREQCCKIMKTVGCMEEKIEFWLSSGSETAYEKLAELCHTEEYLQQARKNTSLAQLKVLCDVWSLEKRAGIKETVFTNCSSLYEADAYFTALKFLIHRIEFGLPEELQRELENFLQNTHTSRFALMLTANQTIYNRKKEIGARFAECVAGLGRQEDILPLIAWGSKR